MKTIEKSHLNISPKYRLMADSYNIILQEKKIITGGKRELTQHKVGDEYWSNLGYYSTPQSALVGIVEHEIKESWVEDLKVMCKKIDDLETMIRKMDVLLTPECPPQSVQQSPDPLIIKSNEILPPAELNIKKKRGRPCKNVKG